MNPVKQKAVEFLEEHWDEIDKKDTEITDSKEKFIDKVKESDPLAWWVLTEVMYWGCKKNYLKEFIVQEDPWTIKIGNQYFQVSQFDEYKEVFPKMKTIPYFE